VHAESIAHFERSIPARTNTERSVAIAAARPSH